MCIERSRDLLGQELAALVGESYERAYQNMVRVQQQTELEETIDYSLAFQLAQGSLSDGGLDLLWAQLLTIVA